MFYLQRYEISIPVWYDYEIESGFNKYCRPTISIPVWYDYELKNRKWYSWTIKFQFQYGTIMSETFFVFKPNEIEISIPVWYDYELTLKGEDKRK